MDCAIETALDMFAKVRPPGIYKQDYLEELYRRYGDVEDAPPAPPLPDWCFEDGDEDRSEDSSSVGDETDLQAGSSAEVPKQRGPRRYTLMGSFNKQKMWFIFCVF